MKSQTPILDQVDSPKDMREFSSAELRQLADELRAETIRAVSHTGGHLGAGLGVVELTVALHHVFNTPDDKLIWDVGHQCYPHKILTGRRHQMPGLRKSGGISGFCKPDESPYDTFGAGHSSTSISAALGLAVARDFAKQDHDVIAVIGDGAMSAGMAYEAMNNAGALGRRLIVILNDNDMSIAPAVGAMSAYLSRMVSSHSYRSLRHLAKLVADKFPEPMTRTARKVEQYARGLATGGTLFEELGFYYVGPIDGHNIDHLLPVLKNVRDEKDSGPILIHVVTQKGKGFDSPEASNEKYHAVKKFDLVTRIQKKSAPEAPSYTNVYADGLIELARQDEKIVAITAAMPSGTGIDKFAREYPERAFDVGIAEQHAVTFAAGLAMDGMKPFVTIYSTFLQRAYDQVVHDVAVQKLPVRFAIDRAGLVGGDGPTHAGAFDVTYLASLPGMVVMAAGDEAELLRMVATAAAIDDRPSAFRYPRGAGAGVPLPEMPQPLEIGKGRVLKEGSKIALLSFGGRLQECLKASEMLDARGLSTTVADARFAKPLDSGLVLRLMQSHDVLVTVEEGSIGGFAAQVLNCVEKHGLLDTGVKRANIRTLFLPDRFIECGTPEEQYEEAALNAEHIAQTALTALGMATFKKTEALI